MITEKIINLRMEGYPTKIIASKLCCSTSTVYTILNNHRRKTKIVYPKINSKLKADTEPRTGAKVLCRYKSGTSNYEFEGVVMPESEKYERSVIVDIDKATCDSYLFIKLNGIAVASHQNVEVIG